MFRGGPMFQGIHLTNKVLDATMMRITTLTDNIANVETPGFKRQDVQFKEQLTQLLEKQNLKNTQIEQLQPKVVTDGGNYRMRIDGNNVDIDREMAELAKTKVRYEVLVQRATAQIGRYKYILQHMK